MINDFWPSSGLETLTAAYKYWIAYADLDGFRVDTVKHMEKGATRYFASVIHEFAHSIGKENFYLIGEITGGRERAFETLEETGLDDFPDKLEYLVKGYRDPADYFNLFRNSLLVHKESHVWSCLYSTDASQIGNRIAVEARNGKAVWLSVPAAGFVFYE